MVLALLIGSVSLAGNFVDIPDIFRVIGPVYFHFYMVGWITQLIFGVAWWMFPVISMENTKGSDKLAWSLYILLNSGLILRSIAEPQQTLNPGNLWTILLLISASVQFIGGVLFAIIIWPRVKPKKTNINKSVAK